MAKLPAGFSAATRRQRNTGQDKGDRPSSRKRKLQHLRGNATNGQVANELPYGMRARKGGAGASSLRPCILGLSRSPSPLVPPELHGQIQMACPPPVPSGYQPSEICFATAPPTKPQETAALL